MSLTDKVDIAILITLWIEFFYDLLWNNREAQIKRRKNAKKIEKAEKKEMEQPILREGTSNVPETTRREVRDL